MRGRHRVAVAAALTVGLGTLAVAAGPDDRATIAEWIKRIDAELAAASAARAPQRQPPPVPVAVTWRPKRLTSLPLASPLLALVGGDLDGNHTAELYAITEREVIALELGAHGITERARIALPAEPAAIRPRDPVATAYVSPGAPPELRVRTSSQARGARYVWAGTALREAGPVDGFPLCPGRALALVTGRNHFGTVDAPIYGVRCRDDLIDRDGTPLAVVAELGAGGALAVTVTPRCAGCAPAAAGARPVYTGGGPVAVPAVGTAYEVADLDRDGAVEVIAAGAGAPGDRDAIKVLTLDGATVTVRKPWRKGFTGGVVAIAVADLDGDGADEVIGAVRLPGSTKVDLWQLNR